MLHFMNSNDIWQHVHMLCCRANTLCELLPQPGAAVQGMVRPRQCRWRRIFLFYAAVCCASALCALLLFAWAVVHVGAEERNGHFPRDILPGGWSMHVILPSAAPNTTAPTRHPYGWPGFRIEVLTVQACHPAQCQCKTTCELLASFSAQ